MPGISSISDLFEALGRDPQELIGQPESEWLDFKKEPYFLNDDRQCLELAKDVTAMANAGDGVIVVGVETEPDHALKREVASSLRPVSQGVIDEKRIQDVIHEWSCPRLDVEIRSHALQGDTGCLWTILVTRQRDRGLPFIVAKEFLGSGGPSRNIFAVYERHSSENRPYRPSQVQQWLHEGYRASLASEEPVPDTSLEQQAAAILQDDIAALALPEGQVLYYIQARPTSAVTIPRFYRGAIGSVFEVLQSIPAIRRHGFNLPDGKPERPAWGGLRVVHPERDSLSISRSGVTTAIMGQRSLTWAAERFAPKNQVWINPLALAEFTFEFWRFHVAEVFERTDHRTPIVWRAGMRNLGDPFPVLLPETLLKSLQPTPDAWPCVSADFHLPWSETRETESGRLAFMTVVEIYANFALGEDVIPCSEGDRITQGGILAAASR